MGMLKSSERKKAEAELYGMANAFNFNEGAVHDEQIAHQSQVVAALFDQLRRAGKPREVNGAIKAARSYAHAFIKNRGAYRDYIDHIEHLAAGRS